MNIHSGVNQIDTDQSSLVEFLDEKFIDLIDAEYNLQDAELEYDNILTAIENYEIIQSVVNKYGSSDILTDLFGDQLTYCNTISSEGVLDKISNVAKKLSSTFVSFMKNQLSIFSRYAKRFTEGSEWLKKQPDNRLQDSNELIKPYVYSANKHVKTDRENVYISIPQVVKVYREHFYDLINKMGQLANHDNYMDYTGELRDRDNVPPKQSISEYKNEFEKLINKCDAYNLATAGKDRIASYLKDAASALITVVGLEQRIQSSYDKSNTAKSEQKNLPDRINAINKEAELATGREKYHLLNLKEKARSRYNAAYRLRAQEFVSRYFYRILLKSCKALDLELKEYGFK